MGYFRLAIFVDAVLNWQQASCPEQPAIIYATTYPMCFHRRTFLLNHIYPALCLLRVRLMLTEFNRQLIIIGNSKTCCDYFRLSTPPKFSFSVP